MARKTGTVGQFVTIPEAARRLGMDPRTFKKLAASEVKVYDFGDESWPRVEWRVVESWARTRPRRALTPSMR